MTCSVLKSCSTRPGLASCNWFYVRSPIWLHFPIKSNFRRESRNSIRKRSTGHAVSLCFSVAQKEASKGENESERMVPRHLAVIMDGNGRWAQSRGQPVSAGHAAGVEALDCLVRQCLKYQIKFVSVFALSIENKNYRSLDEIEFLLNLVKSAINNKLSALNEAGGCYFLAVYCQDQSFLIFFSLIVTSEANFLININILKL